MLGGFLLSGIWYNECGRNVGYGAGDDGEAVVVERRVVVASPGAGCANKVVSGCSETPEVRASYDVQLGLASGLQLRGLEPYGGQLGSGTRVEST